MTNHSEKIPILLLAAGSSTRMGRSKQLLVINGKPLLQKTVEELLDARTGEVIVVLGANAAAHKKVIDHCAVHIVENNQWQNGMGTSIKAGMKFIEDQFSKSKAVIISVCDQPYLTSAHIKELTQAYRKSKKSIVASLYNETQGVPVLFGRLHFEALSQIQGMEGAKKVIRENSSRVISVPFPPGAIDLDTKEDYDTFNQ